VAQVLVVWGLLSPPPDQSEAPKGSPGDPEPAAVEWSPRRSKNLLHYENLSAFRLNPLGLVNVFGLGYRRVLWDRPGPIYENTYAELKLSTLLAPPYARVGPEIAFTPFAFVRVAARYEFATYWNAFGILQSFPTATADTSPKALKDGADTSYATTGHVVTLQGTLQARWRNVAARSELTAAWSKLDLRDGDVVFQEPATDVLTPNDSWVLVNDVDLAYLFDSGLVLGARYTVTHAIYEDRHFAAGEQPSNPNTPMHRVGPVVAYRFFERPGARVENVSIFMLAQWWAAHRYRTGQAVSPAMPYLVVGVQFEGQLLPLSPRYPPRGRSRR
jgi:hypothetical protein